MISKHFFFYYIQFKNSEDKLIFRVFYFIIFKSFYQHELYLKNRDLIIKDFNFSLKKFIIYYNNMNFINLKKSLISIIRITPVFFQQFIILHNKWLSHRLSPCSIIFIHQIIVKFCSVIKLQNLIRLLKCQLFNK